MKLDKKLLNNLELRNNSKNVDFFLNIIANRLLNNNDRNLQFLENFRDFLKDQLLEKGRTKKDISKIFKRIFNRFAVPGIINKNGKLLFNTNLDAKASLFLLRKVGFRSKNISYQKDYLDTKDSCVNLTLGNIDGINIEGYEITGLKSFLSNANITINNSNRTISSVTNIIFNLLKELDLIDDVKHIERFVKFIDLKSNSFDVYNINGKETKPYLDSYKTLFGLSNNLPIKFIFDYFKSDKTGFEVFTDKELNQITYKNNKGRRNLLKISQYRKDMINYSLIMIDKYIKNNIFLKYKNQNIDFILDNQSIPNALEVCSYYNKGLIRVYDTGDIIIFNPKGFYNKFSFLGVSKLKKIAFIKSYDDYDKKLEKLMNIFGNNKLKYKFLLNTNYHGKLLDTLKPENKVSKRTKEIQKVLKSQKKKRIKRIDNSISIYENQVIEEKDLKIGKILKGKIFSISNSKPSRIYISIHLKTEDDWNIYTTPIRLKSKDYEIKAFYNEEELIHTFKIIKVKKDSKKVILKQI